MTPLRLHYKIEKKKTRVESKLEGDGLQVWVFLEMMEETSV